MTTTLQHRDNTWQFEGELTMRPIEASYARWIKTRPKQGEWVIDCKSVSRIDSAGLAFLLDCIAYSTSKKLSLRMLHLPRDAFKLMKAQGVDGLFGGICA